MEPNNPPHLEASHREKIKLTFSSNSLHHAPEDANIRVQCVPQDAGNTNLIGETQLIRDASGFKSTTPIIIDFIFESQQRISFFVINANENKGIIVGSIGSVRQTTLSSIINSKDQTCTFTLEGAKNTIAGELTIQAEKMSGGSNTIISWQWSARNLTPSSNFLQKISSALKLSHARKPSELNPFLKFCKVRSAKNSIEVAKTKACKETSNPTWKNIIEVQMDKLCDTPTSPFRIECWDFIPGEGSHLFGACETTLEAIRSGTTQFELHDVKSKEIIGTLEVVLNPDQVQAQEYSFLDYITGGTQIKTIFAVDFTESNGNTKSSSSLHHLLPQRKPNEYQKAITSIYEILSKYDSNTSAQVYGFGGIPHYPELDSKTVSHCFPCTGKTGQPEAKNLDDLIDAYINSVIYVQLAGSRCLTPVIREAINTSRTHKEKDEDVYTVLVIFAAGEIQDVQESVDAIIEASQLPLSIVIVGIGKEKFSNVKVFDGLKDRVSSNYEEAARDVVQFLPVKHFGGDTDTVAKYLLREIPGQLVQYMKFIDKKPKEDIRNSEVNARLD